MERISYQEVPSTLFMHMRKMEDYIASTTLDQSILELLRLRVSQINGCAYCVDMHHKELVHLGETELRLSSLLVWKETPYFSAKERAVLEFSEAVNDQGESAVSDKVYAPLLEYYSKEEICNLTLAVSHMSTWNSLMKVFRFTPGLYQAGQ